MKELILFCCLLFASFDATATIIFGSPVAMGAGEAQTYVRMDKSGDIVALGIALTGAALKGLPDYDMTQYLLPMPPLVKAAPFNHVVVDWNPHGHDPSPIYAQAHFDFHFYLISEAERAAITCQGQDRDNCLLMPSPEYLPPYYIPTPEGVPQMGWHWVDPRSPEFNGQIFTATFIYGFYGGQMSFLEPMITRDFLMAKTCLEKEIPIPEKFPQAGRYPQSYGIYYHAPTDKHFITLKNFMTP